MSEPLSDADLAEIHGHQLGDWLTGEWRTRWVDLGDPHGQVVEVYLDDTVIATLPDWAHPVATWIGDTHDDLPKLLDENDRLRAEVQRLTGRYDAGITAVTDPSETASGLWRVRYRRDGRRKARTFDTRQLAEGYATNLRKGGEPR